MTPEGTGERDRRKREEAMEVTAERSRVPGGPWFAEINITNWTDFEIAWYLISNVETNRQSGPVFALRYYCVESLFSPSSFPASHLNGILAITVVAIGRISINAETG